MKRLLFLAVAALISAACCQTSNSEAEAVDNVIMSRRSIRNYKQIPVSRDTLQVILKAGINAPNGQNRQSWEIRVVDNPDTMSEIKAAMSAANPDVPMAGDSFRNAPVMAFIAADTSYDFSLLDCGNAVGKYGSFRMVHGCRFHLSWQSGALSQWLREHPFQSGNPQGHG